MAYIDGFVIPVPSGNWDAYLALAKKAARDAGNEKIMADPRKQPDGDMPFSGARLIFGGFTPMHDMKVQDQ